MQPGQPRTGPFNNPVCPSYTDQQLRKIRAFSVGCSRCRSEEPYYITHNNKSQL
jgi:hypothetical protein